MDQLYRQYGYPAKTKLYQIARDKGLKVTMKDVDEFLKKTKCLSNSH